MAEPDPVDELMARWARAPSDRKPTADELAAGRPDLLAEVRRRLGERPASPPPVPTPPPVIRPPPPAAPLDSRVHDLLSAWERADVKPTAEALCAGAGCPELADEVRRHIEGLAAMGRLLTAGRLAVPGYRVLDELGRGGQAVVYKAVQLSTGRDVAVKVLTAGRFAGRAEQQRLAREGQVLASLRHPNVVQVIDRGTTPDGYYYLVMAYVPGRPLTEWLERWRRPTPGGAAAAADDRDPAELLRVFLKVCSAVNAAHLKGVIHRDLKPSNILVDAGGEPHVLDFGLARSVADLNGDGGDPAGPPPLTVSGQFLGSLPWASPEQAEGAARDLDTRTDVYSLGVILYQFLTGGRFPYKVVGTMREVLDNILRAKPVPPSKAVGRPVPRRRRRWRRLAAGQADLDRLPAINPGLEAIVLKALSKRRADRYGTAGDLARDIERYLAGLPTGGRDGGAGGARRWALAAAGGGAAGAAVTLAWVLAAWGSGLAGGGQPLPSPTPPQPPPPLTQPVTGAATRPDERPGTRPAPLAAAAAAARHLAAADLPPAVRAAAARAVEAGGGPAADRWAGRAGDTVFGVAAVRLPPDAVAANAAAGLLDAANALATAELVAAAGLTDLPGFAGVDDAAALREAARRVGGDLLASGSARAVDRRAAVDGGGFAVAVATARAADVSARLTAEPASDRLRMAYRDVLHERVRQRMAARDWDGALDVCLHLHERRLTSPPVYLDAAECYLAVDQPADALKMVDACLAKFGRAAAADYLERAGRLALTVGTAEAKATAGRAFAMASDRLRSQVAPAGPPQPDPLPP